VKYEDVVRQITPELYATFKRSIEQGRWPDGRRLTEAQREHCMQAMIAYDQLHKTEIERVGFIDRKHKAGDAGQSVQTMRWVVEEDPGLSEEE
jgi:uncharacterized protein YeaC (DUF1315 family)